MAGGIGGGFLSVEAPIKLEREIFTLPSVELSAASLALCSSGGLMFTSLVAVLRSLQGGSGSGIRSPG